MEAFQEEVAAFERLKPQLQEQYGTQYVAFHGGKVVASGAERFQLLQQVYEEYGEVPCFIQRPADSVRVVRAPSVHVARR